MVSPRRLRLSERAAAPLVAGLLALLVATPRLAHAGAEDVAPAAAPAPVVTDDGAHATPPPPPGLEADKPIVVWPTLTPAGDEVGAMPLHRPIATDGPLAARAQELDATLRDAVQDLGFTLDVADQGPLMSRTRDLDLVDRAAQSTKRGGEKDSGTWVVSARLEPAGGDTFVMRILAVPPRGKVLRVRVERVAGADVSVRGLVLLRDLLSNTGGGESESGPRPQESANTGLMSNLRSQGRAVLATNAALFGAFTAFSIQRASGSDDPRLLYPLVTLGTGIGLGGALLVAEEWNIGTGDAWTLAGSAWWGTAAGILIANGQHVQPLRDRYAWGVGGGLIGLTLATFSLTRGHADEGDAVLVNSGAALGLGLGSLGDFFYRGNIQSHTPYTGAGIGTAAGLLAGGALAAFTQVSPSRVLLVDLGAGSGAAAGAAVASPLVFENVTSDKARGFVALTAGGTLVGGGIAWYLTREKKGDATKRRPDATSVRPFGGVIGASQTRTGAEPAYGAGVRGAW